MHTIKMNYLNGEKKFEAWNWMLPGAVGVIENRVVGVVDNGASKDKVYSMTRSLFAEILNLSRNE